MPLFTVTEDRSYLLLGLLLMGCSVALGAFTRRLGAGEIPTRLAQLLPVLLLPWLVPALRDPWRLAARTVDHVQQSFAPMPYSEGFAVFTAAMLWVTFLVLETLAVGLRTPAWTFPVLVMPYAVCALSIYTETNPFLFGFPALGFILVLSTSVRNGALASLPAEATERRWRTGVTRAAAAAGGLALILSVVLSVPIAERSGNATNPGGTGAVQLGDPSIDLIRNVTSSSGERVISYTTTDAAARMLGVVKTHTPLLAPIAENELKVGRMDSLRAFYLQAESIRRDSVARAQEDHVLGETLGAPVLESGPVTFRLPGQSPRA